MSWPLLRSDQILVEAAVASGVQGRKACGETPSTSALCPLTVTFPPSTGSTAATPPSLRILASWAGVIPPGTAAIRSGTNCCRAAASLGTGELVGPAVGARSGREPDETWEEGVPPAGDATAASAAWTADPATVRDSAVAAAAIRATRRRDNSSTMYMT